jgi:hypothetical protein
MTTLDDPRGLVDPSGVSVWPTAMRYGGILAGIGIVLGLVMYLTGMLDPETGNQAVSGSLGCLSVILTIVFYVFAVKKHRDADLGGSISFGRAFGVGMATALVNGGISAVWGIIFNNLIAPDIMEKTRDMMLSQAQPGQEELMETIANVMANPIVGPLATLVGSLLMGAIFSLIIAAIMKKEPALNV